MKKTIYLVLLVIGFVFPLAVIAQARNSTAGVKVYAAGSYEEGANRWPCYWINGVRQTLDATGIQKIEYNARGAYVFAEAITFVDNSIYIVGRSYNTVYLWKDGVRSTVAQNSNGLTVSGITISNGSVYILGALYRGTIGERGFYVTACYWKDGVVYNLDRQGVPSTSSTAGTSLVVNNNSVYVAGFYDYYRGDDYVRVACYWKDGVRQNLDLQGVRMDDIGSTANDIVVSGNSVHIAGMYYDGRRRACYWKDGVRQTLDHENFPGRIDANAAAITLDGTTVYTAGSNDYRDESGNRYVSAYFWNDAVRKSLDPSNKERYHNVTAIKVLNKRVYVFGYYYDMNNTKNRNLCYWLDGKFYDLGIIDTAGSSLFFKLE